jgi:hypothetical protein
MDMNVKRTREWGGTSGSKDEIVDALGNPEVFPTKMAAIRAARRLSLRGSSPLGRTGAMKVPSGGWIVVRKKQGIGPRVLLVKPESSVKSTRTQSAKTSSGKKSSVKPIRRMVGKKDQAASRKRDSASVRLAPWSRKSWKRPKAGEVDWDAFAASIRPDSTISVRIDGYVSEVDALGLEVALREAVRSRGFELRREAVAWGSWRARFVAFLSRHFGEEDVDTAKRSAEVRLVTVPDSGAQKTYAEGMAVLISTINSLPNDAVILTEGYLVAKLDGVVMGRQLSQKESDTYRRGGLEWVMESPKDAMAFVTGKLSIARSPAPALTDGT